MVHLPHLQPTAPSWGPEVAKIIRSAVSNQPCRVKVLEYETCEGEVPAVKVVVEWEDQEWSLAKLLVYLGHAVEEFEDTYEMEETNENKKDEVILKFEKNCVVGSLKQDPGDQCSDDEESLISLMELPMIMMKEEMKVTSPKRQEAKQVEVEVLRIESPGQVWVRPLSDHWPQFQLLLQRSGTKLGQLQEEPRCGELLLAR